MSSKIRVRFAPSPTGHLHVGSARVALFNWLFARHHNGQFLIRVEDTDRKRSKKEYEESIMESLKWLGMMPDENVVFQLERQPEYKVSIFQLLEKKAIYPCFCDFDPTKYEEASITVPAKYDRHCREKEFTQEDLKQPHALRFKIPDDVTSVTFNDIIRGDITINAAELDDFIIVRRDGVPTYNLSVVLDDAAMKISHVIRGEDHISNTSKQILLYRSLGMDIPLFAHLPMILSPEGDRLSKRYGAVNVIDYKQQGILPAALLNYLARLGWSCGDQEIFSLAEMVEKFSLEEVNKSNARFDRQKLDWMNGVYIKKMTAEKALHTIKELDSLRYEQMIEGWGREPLLKLIDLYKGRCLTLMAMADDIITLASRPFNIQSALLETVITDKSLGLLNEFLMQLAFITQERFTPEVLLTCARDLAKKQDASLPELAKPLRIGLTGNLEGPGVFHLLPFLSKEEAVDRIRLLVSRL